MIKTPLLVTGQFRSGTTLLSKLVSTFSECTCYSDSIHLFRLLSPYFLSSAGFRSSIDSCSDEQLLTLIHKIIHAASQRIGVKLLDKSVHSLLVSSIDFSSFLFDLFLLIFQQQTSDVIPLVLGEKTVCEWHAAARLLGQGENLKVIHIVRDPRPVFVSFKKLTNLPAPSYYCSPFISLDSIQSAIYYSKLFPSSYLVLSYEELVCNPINSLENIQVFLGCSGLQDLNSLQLMDNSLSTPWMNDSIYSIKDGEISYRHMHMWKEKISDLDCSIIDFICGPEYHLFNYKRLFDDNIGSSNYKKVFENPSPVISRYSNYYSQTKHGISNLPGFFPNQSLHNWPQK